MSERNPVGAAVHRWLRGCVAVGLLLCGLPAQDLARALAKAEQAVADAKVAERPAAVGLIAEAMDALEAAPGVADSDTAAYWGWMLGLEAKRCEAWREGERAWRLAEAWYARHPGDRDVYVLSARLGLAEALAQQNAPGKVLEAQKLQRQVLDSHVRHSGPDSDAALGARYELATTLNRLGQHADAEPEWLAIVEAYRKRGDETNLHWARINLSDVYENLPNHGKVLEVAQAMIDRARELFPPGSEERLQRTIDASHSYHDIGYYRVGRSIASEALREFRGATEDQYRRSPGYWLGLHQLGLCLQGEGDLPGALATWDEYFELVLEGNPETSSLAGAAQRATTIRMVLGDHRGARELAERVLARLPEDVLGWTAPIVLRDHAAEAAMRNGEFDVAGRFLRANLDKMETLFPDPEEQRRRAWFPRVWDGMSHYHLATGDLDLARVFADRVLWHEGTGIEYYPASARFVLALIGHRANPTSETATALIAAYEAWEALSWRPGRQTARKLLLLALTGSGNDRQFGDVLLAGLGDSIGQMADSLFLADRARAEMLGHVRPDIDWALSLGDASQSLLQRRLFEVIETRRAASMAMSGLSLQRGKEELDQLLREYSEVRERLGETVPLSAGDRPRIGGTELQKLRMRRDSLQQRIRGELTQLGKGAVKVTASDVAARLDRRASEAAVGYYRYTHWTVDAAAPGGARTEDRFVVHVLLPGDDTVHRVELGSASAIEQAIVAWRAAIGVPVERGRPVDADEGQAGTLGERLRQLVFDPLRPLLDGAKTKSVYLCPDDALHLVPLDALPLARQDVRGQLDVLGDRWVIRVLPSFQALVSPLPRLASASPTLLALGGVDFARAKAPEPEAALTRGDDQPFDFEQLPFTTDEVVKIADYFATTFKKKAVLLRGGDAHKASFVEHAPGSSFLHLATHGWFAPPEVRSLADPVGSGVAGASSGHSPLALCGLALAGANQGRDADGRLPGILTAEHVAGLDLRKCELAVLSACRTNVGLRRGGQSIQSLQTALHAAGARCAVTSLWRVPDALTEQLMVRFYRNLWEKKQEPAEALWEAKAWLRRQQGAGLQHWAAWVLTSQ